MKKIFEKHETLFCMLLIILYVVINSYCIQNFGVEDYRSTIINTIFSAFLIVLIIKLDRVKYYGLVNVKTAIIVSAITFGIGHIVNLLNGADLAPTLIQICYAISIGYLFVIIFYKSKSLIPCIITHALVNSLSIFNIDNVVSLYIAPIFLIIVPICYAAYINKTVKE